MLNRWLTAPDLDEANTPDAQAAHYCEEDSRLDNKLGFALQ